VMSSVVIKFVYFIETDSQTTMMITGAINKKVRKIFLNMYQKMIANLHITRDIRGEIPNCTMLPLSYKVAFTK
jgi:hypothetical protein